MTEHRDFTQLVDAALAELDRAIAHDGTRNAVDALTRIGAAEVALGPESLLTAPQAAGQREALRSRVAGHADLIARAAATLDHPIRRRPETGLRDSLLARTGYQVLLDLGSWSEPPLDDFHLGEVEKELADAVLAAPPEVPDGVPPAHRWWWPPADAGA